MTVRGALLALALSCALPADAVTQFAGPCDLTCAVVLVADSYVLGSGSAAAAGRLMGGFSTPRQGIIAWSSGFATSAVAGVALSGNGGRQRRAIYSAGIGAVGGGLFALALESAVGESTGATRLAAAMIGAGAGVVIGGVLGAMTFDDSAGPVQPNAALTPTLSFRIGF